MASVAQGSPTKDFFVGMLTRDIDLNDAILDLLDNCLDGVLRLKGKNDSTDFYSGFKASILIAPNSFAIIDNCGGIPRDVAEEKAFRMGRPMDDGDSNTPSVGIYGIGMKRAIFKIGRKAEVVTSHGNSQYSVLIPSDWAIQDRWDFPINDAPSIPLEISGGGTIIKVEELNQGIAELWKDIEHIKTYVNRLIQDIQKSYSLIIERGFEITVNDNVVSAKPTQLLASSLDKGIKPFIYKNVIDGVSIKLAIGFYASLPSDEEIDRINEERRASADAGWTIVCNDRVVLYNDKSFLTGWGEAGVPNYHTQFIGIRGIVFFESNNPSKLPMTTTKRGVDLSSPIYAAVKEEMRKGLKLFTNYTNQWKGRLQQEKEYSIQTKSLPIMKIIDDATLQEEIGIVPVNRKGAQVYSPVLPKPEIERDYVFIRYSKPKADVEKLSIALFNEVLDEVGASAIGEKCFDIVLENKTV